MEIALGNSRAFRDYPLAIWCLGYDYVLIGRTLPSIGGEKRTVHVITLREAPKDLFLIFMRLEG